MHTSVTIRVVPYSVNIVSGFYRRCGAEFFGGIEPELKNKIPTCQYQYYWSRSREFEIPKKTTKVTRLCKGGGFSQGPVLCPRNFTLCTIFGRMPGFEPE